MNKFVEIVMNKNKVVLPFLIYFLVAGGIHALISLEWAISHDAYAEVVTNYHQTAYSNSSLIDQLLTVDHGYILPIMRVAPYISNLIMMSDVAFLNTVYIASTLLIVGIPSIFISNKFHYCVNNTFIRLLSAIFLSASFNFESRIYINSSYMFIPLIFICQSLLLKGGQISFLGKLALIVILVAKPFTITLLPFFMLILYRDKSSKFFSVLALTISLINFYFTSLSSANSIIEINFFSLIQNVLILAFYNIGKITLFFGPAIYLKLYPTTNIAPFLIISALVGLVSLLVAFKYCDLKKRQYIICIFLVNIAWSTLVISGSGNSNLFTGQIGFDFNRYDVITSINLLFIVIFLNEPSKRFIYLSILLFLFYSITIYSSASIYQYYKKIRTNILYVGTSTWLTMKHDKEYSGCALLSPLGWAYKCQAITNVTDRLQIPISKFYKGEFTIEIPASAVNGYIALFTSGLNPELNVHELRNNEKLNGKSFALPHNRYVLIHKISCPMKDFDIPCEIRFYSDGVELYSLQHDIQKPIIVFFSPK